MSWHARVILVHPARVQRALDRIAASGHPSNDGPSDDAARNVPNLWQIELGVLRMWHRVLFRSDTVGTCKDLPVRDNWRARVLNNRAIRFPFLLSERAIAPLDFSGMVSPPWRIRRHLLGTHHDDNQFVYDLQLLSFIPGELAKVKAAAEVIVNNDTPRSRYLRDLCVYDGYHERLLAAVSAALDGELELPEEQASDPDVTFYAYLRWCADQPESPSKWLASLKLSRLPA